jgi:hypothetical protein
MMLLNDEVEIFNPKADMVLTDSYHAHLDEQLVNNADAFFDEREHYDGDPLSSCCNAPILQPDANFHGHCKGCNRHATPDDDYVNAKAGIAILDNVSKRIFDELCAVWPDKDKEREHALSEAHYIVYGLMDSLKSELDEASR